MSFHTNLRVILKSDSGWRYGRDLFPFDSLPYSRCSRSLRRSPKGVELQRGLIGRPWQAWLGRRLGYDISDTATADDDFRGAPSRFGTYLGYAGAVLIFLGISVILEGLRGRGT